MRHPFANLAGRSTVLAAPLLACAFLLGFAQSAWSQQSNGPKVTQIPLKIGDQKELRALSKKMPLFRVGGVPSVMGEIAFDEGEWKAGAPLDVYVPSLPKRPKLSKPLAEAPYEFDKDGKRKVIGKLKKLRVSIPNKNLNLKQQGNTNQLQQNIISEFSLYSICADLEQRRTEVLELKDRLKRIKQEDDPEEWAQTRTALIMRWEGLIQYVENSMLFKTMAVPLRSEFEDGVEEIRDAESVARANAFRKAIAEAEPEAIDLGKEENCEFFQLESPHVRIVYLVGDEGIDHEYAEQLLILAEESIEHFRQIAIEPFAEFREEQANPETRIIPETIFQEFVVGTNDKATQQTLYEEWHQVTDTDERSFETEATGGIRRSRRDDPLYSIFSKNIGSGLMGLVVHQVGHTMASLQYNRISKEHVASALPMLQEAVAMHLAFEKLGHNTIRCTNFRDAKYTIPEIEDVHKQVQIWDTYRDRFYKLALTAPSLSDSATMPLNKLNEGHMAKGWLAYQYILANDGVKGQRWLRQMHDSITKEGDGDRTGLDRNQWRDLTKELYGGDVEGDPLLQFEDLWKESAEEGLKKD